MEQEVARVERPPLRQHPVVGQEDLGELALAVAGLLGPGGEAPGVDQLLLARVDPAHERPEQRRRPAAEVVVAQVELVDPLLEHGQAIGGRGGHGERVEAGRARLVGQQAGAEAVDAVDRRLLVRLAQRRLGPAAQGAGQALAVGQDEDLARRAPAGHQPGQPPDEHLGLARARAADDH